MPKFAAGGAASAATILHNLLTAADVIELANGLRVLVVPVDSAVADALMLFDPDGDADREPDADHEPDADTEHEDDDDDRECEASLVRANPIDQTSWAPYETAYTADLEDDDDREHHYGGELAR